MSLLILVLTLSAASPASPVDVGQTLKSAIEDFEFGEHAKAQKKLESLLNPLVLESAEDVIVARQYLGACYYLLDQKPRAEAELAKILALDPEHKLDPEVFSPALVQFFEEVRARTGIALLKDKQRRAAAEEPKPPEPPPPPPPAAATASEPSPAAVAAARAPIAPRHSVALAFVPFGVGQFTNHHPIRGTLFAVGEVALLTTALITYVSFNGLVEDRPDGTVRVIDPADKDRAAALQTTALATFYSGLGLMALGIIEALVSYPGTESGG